MANLYNGYSDLQYAVSNADQNSLNNGLDAFALGWEALFGMAAVCLPSNSVGINYAGLCGSRLMELTNDVTFALDNTQIHFYNLDMTSAVHSLIGSFPISDYNNNILNQSDWYTFGVWLAELQHLMWNQAWTWYTGKPSECGYSDFSLTIQ